MLGFSKFSKSGNTDNFSVYVFVSLSEMTSSSRSGDFDILEDAVYDFGL